MIEKSLIVYIDCLIFDFQLKIGTCGLRFNSAEVAFYSQFENYVEYIYRNSGSWRESCLKISKFYLILIAEQYKMSSPLLTANQIALKCFREQIKLNPKKRTSLIYTEHEVLGKILAAGSLFSTKNLF